MRYLSDWSLDDGSLLLNFSDDVLQVFADHVQTDTRPESGGVLLGTVEEMLLAVASRDTSANGIRTHRTIHLLRPLTLTSGTNSPRCGWMRGRCWL